MKDYELVHWKADGMPLQYVESKGKKRIVFLKELFALLLFFYLVIGFFTFLGVVDGQAQYMPFWHAPWKILIKFLL